MRPQPIRPVFIIGPARAGTNLLASSLGQHGRFRTVAECHWLPSFATQLLRVVVAAGEDPGRPDPAAANTHDLGMHEVFARAVNDVFVRTPSSPPRWVAAPPDAAAHAVALATIFPGARFIHVVRHVFETIALLTRNDISKLYGTYFSPHRAYEHWLRVTRACVNAEEALGPEQVLRISYADLLSEPVTVLSRCLDFVDEAWDQRCLRPLHGVSPMANVGERDDVLHYRVRREANELYEQLLTTPQSATVNHELLAELKASSLHAARATDVDDSQAPFRQLVELAANSSARVLVVSRGDDRLLNIAGTTAMHFPRTPDGKYVGYHPKDSAEAVEFLEAERSGGATHIAFPASSAWWLDHYAELRAHLGQRATVVAHADEIGTLFDLRSSRPSIVTTAVPTSASQEDKLADRVRELEERLDVLRRELDAQESEFWATEAVGEFGADAGHTAAPVATESA